jgi:hypothetical protein
MDISFGSLLGDRSGYGRADTSLEYDATAVSPVPPAVSKEAKNGCNRAGSLASRETAQELLRRLGLDTHQVGSTGCGSAERASRFYDMLAMRLYCELPTRTDVAVELERAVLAGLRDNSICRPDALQRGQAHNGAPPRTWPPRSAGVDSPLPSPSAPTSGRLPGSQSASRPMTAWPTGCLATAASELDLSAGPLRPWRARPQ